MFSMNEIFTSIQGEGPQIGRKALFIRFIGCNLQCEFCDTKTNIAHFFPISLQDLSKLIARNILDHGINYIVFTGGEPLLQKELPRLIDFIVEFSKSYEKEILIGIETNGTQPLESLLEFAEFISLTVSPKVSEGHPHGLHSDYFSCIGTPVAHWKETSVKLLHPYYLLNGEKYETMGFDYFFVQPIFPLNGSLPDFEAVINSLSIFSNKWRLSPQLHKLINVR